MFLMASALAFALSLLGLLAGCGDHKIKPPTGLSYAQSSIVATVGTQITTDEPTVTGTVSSWTISQALPAGLSLSTSTGAIAGTPTTASAPTTYTVTATNSSGSTTTKVQVTVNAAQPAPSNLNYPQINIVATVGTQITTDTPSVTGTVSSWTISPALPLGLSLSTSTGAISGTPTAASAQTTYTVTAANAGGSTKATVQITVNAVVAAPTNLSYPATTIAAISGHVITGDTPTVVGVVSNWSVTPSLPAGLSLNSTTGAISGTPTAVTASSNYIVTAANTGGAANATLQIAVVADSVNQTIHAGFVSGHQSVRGAYNYTFPLFDSALPSTSPIKPALVRELRNRFRPAKPAAKPAPEAEATLTYSSDLDLYMSGMIQNGTVLAMNFYTDAAGTIPAGAITATFPSGITAGAYTGSDYPITIPITANLTAGKMPCTGSGTIAFTDAAGAGTVQGTLTFPEEGLSVTASFSFDDNFNLTANSLTITENGEQIAITNIQGSLTGNQVGTAVLMPQNYTGTVNFSLVNGTFSAVFNTPNGVATGSSANGVLTLQYPDGSTETLTDPNGTQPNAPPSPSSASGLSNLSYAIPSIAATEFEVIANDTPTVSGTATSWSIAPALPTGLTINAASGMISGTPTVVSPEATYVVNASNASGFTQGTVQIVVVAPPAPTNLSYQQTSITAVVGTAITSDIPTVTGPVTAWSITPALPTQLSIDTTSGVISGTPNVASPQTTYTVSASNPTGAATTTLQISVSAAGNGNVGFTYPVNNIVANVDQAITPDVPVLVGAFTSFNVAPALPYGMSIDQTTGIISGAPAVQIPPTAFQVYGYTVNQGVSETIQITVNEAPSQGIVAQNAVFTGSLLNLASFPSPTAQSFQWTLTNQTSGGTITAGSATDLIQYSANSTPGTYQLSVTAQAASGNTTTVSRTLNVVKQQFLKDPTSSWDRGVPTASQLINGTVLAVGTQDLNPSSMAPYTTEIFDPVSQSFSDAEGMIAPRANGQAQVTLQNGKVLVCGGMTATMDVYNIYETTGPIVDAEIYDPAANTWTLVGPMNVARTGHTATMLQNGKVLVAGGLDANNNGIATAEIYDPVANTWTTVASLHTGRFGDMATLLNDGTVLVTGGYSHLDRVYGNTNATTNEVYDPAANNWTVVGSFVTYRTAYTATLLTNGKVLFTGGYNYDPNYGYAFFNSTEIYDPVTKTFSAGVPMQVTRSSHSATQLSSGKVLVAGGGNQYSTPVASAEIYDPVATTWTTTASLNIPRFSHVAFALPGGDVVVAYGTTIGGQGQSSAEIYNPTANTWTPFGMTAQLSGSSATQLANGQVLVAGGSSPAVTGVTTLAQIFNPATNRWSIVAPLNTARERHTATVLQSGKVLVVGGDIAVGATYYSAYPEVVTSAELYDPAAGTWSAVASLIAGRTAHTATLLSNGKVLVTGGLDSNGAIVTTAEVYDPQSNAWIATGSPITPRYSHTATLLNTGKVLVAGGSSYLASGPNSTAELYDPSTNTWTAAAAMPTGVAMHTATLLSDGTMVVTGGYASSGASSGAMLFNPTTNAWSQLASMQNPREEHAATLLSSGQILVTGGYGSSAGNGTIIPSEIYTPSTNIWTSAAPLNMPRYQHSSTVLNDGRVMVVGGDPGYVAEFWKP